MNLIFDSFDHIGHPFDLHRGEDYIQKFVEQLTEIKKDIFNKMNVNKPMDERTYEQKTAFRNATNCLVCGKKFEPPSHRAGQAFAQAGFKFLQCHNDSLKSA